MIASSVCASENPTPSNCPPRKHFQPMHFFQRLIFPAFLSLTLLISGCGLLPDEIDETRDWTVQQLYTEGKLSSQEGAWENAIDYFTKLLARYPFGKYAQQAYLEKAYAHYRSDEPDAAEATLSRFLKTYPRHPSADYAYYLKGLVQYNRGQTFLQRYLPVDLSERDPGPARESFRDFKTVVERFPRSDYAEDARQRMVHLRDSLARYELHVADFYMRRGAYLAAANRAKAVIENYQHTATQEEALQIMIMAYEQLGLTALREDAIRVLKLNYPQTQPNTFVADQQSFWDSLVDLVSFD